MYTNRHYLNFRFFLISYGKNILCKLRVKSGELRTKGLLKISIRHF